MTEIIEINNDHSLFDSIPAIIYPADSLRLKQKDGINKEYVYKTLVALHNNTPSARLVIYNNPHLKYDGAKAVCIGNFESVDNIIVSNALFSKAFEIIKTELNIPLIIGPMNGSTWDNYRFSVHHHFPNFFLEPHHHLYYNNLFEEAGFTTLANYISSVDTSLYLDSNRITPLKEKFQAMDVIIRSIDVNNFETELEKVYHLSIEAFKNNFLYTPISLASFMEKYTAIKPLMKPELILMAEDKNKNLIGFMFSVNDLYNTSEKSLIVKTIARKNEKKYSGLGALLAYEIIKTAKENKYSSVIHAFMFEEATSLGLSEKFTGKVFKNYKMYRKILN